MKKVGCGEYTWKLSTGVAEKVRGSLASQFNLMSKHQDRKRTALKKEEEWHVMNDIQSWSLVSHVPAQTWIHMHTPPSPLTLLPPTTIKISKPNKATYGFVASSLYFMHALRAVH